jgi:lipopolysaccharide/colanic/teichoic acid biosynthesis glycosyltransferase
MKIVKRIFDVIMSSIILIALSPLLIVIYIAIIMKLGRPAIFQQKRPGKDNRIFTLYKFRSMTDKKDHSGNLLSDADRLTKLGKFLRKSSIDELPELFNILIGDMSFVGPRPLLVQYIPRYNKTQLRRHEVRPGLTGWAQINGRNAIRWEEKFDLDVWYVDNWSIWLDLKILLKTIAVVLNRSGVNAEGEATTKEFMGSSED